MYAGHSSPDGRIQPLSEHLHNVAEYCRKFAKPFGCGDIAYASGLAHDIGKYSMQGQNRILRQGTKVDHATAGGLEIARVCGPLGAYCVMGHHGGLPDGGSRADGPGDSTLYGRMKKTVADRHIPDYAAFTSEIEIPQVREPPLKPLGKAGFSYSMLIRMLFSCLVDADFLDTEDFMNQGRVRRGGFEGIPVLLDKLKEHLAKFENPTTGINKKRNEIMWDCVEAGKGEKGLYSLTVPTGGGKTISSLAFALTHAARHGMQRVIYVIPYTNIIEQTAGVFADILGSGNVLEHHASLEYDNEDDEQKKLYLSTENWDAPVIVTTNVQFFESLFASKTSKCRKLHNISSSVIIFDEAQMLPAPYLLACTRAIAELVHNFGCTAVLCSATQPALDPFFPKEVQRREICQSPQELHSFFKRVQIQEIGKISDQELGEKLRDAAQVLCIVNTRKQAQNLYGLIGEGEGNFHLSTLMYPRHRKAILETVRKRLKDKLPCRVVATSLVEAGVDVDFPRVFRARAGLDSIVQAAGRCNREGKGNAQDSFTYVFEPEDTYKLPASWRQPAEVAAITARKHPQDIAGLEAIRDYFQLLYALKGESLDAKAILSRLEEGYQKGASFPFRQIGEEFRLIEEATRTILIPDTGESAQYAALLREGVRGRSLMRKMGPYCVSVYENHYRELRELGVIECLDSQIAILADLASYSPQTGLALSPEGGKAIFDS